jgi:transposase
LHLIDGQIAKLNSMIAQAMKPHQEAVMRLAEVPGLGVDSAQQIIAEVGVLASAFTSAAELTSWVGPVPARRKVRRKTTAVALPKATNICGEC